VKKVKDTEMVTDNGNWSPMWDGLLCESLEIVKGVSLQNCSSATKEARRLWFWHCRKVIYKRFQIASSNGSRRRSVGLSPAKTNYLGMAQALDQELEQWRLRPLTKKDIYLVMDACHEYIREDGRIESDGVLTVRGVDEKEYREILSVTVAPGEEEANWG
jgi:hypothetical protein